MRTYSQTVHKALGKTLTKSQRHHQRVVRPEGLRIAQFRSVVLAESAGELYRYDQRQQAMERLAGLMQDRLNDLLKDVPPQLPMKLGRLACFEEPVLTRRRKMPRQLQVIGAEPTGWRGPRANYPCQNHEGYPSVLQQLAAEDALYRETLTDVNAWFEPKEIVADPYVAVTQSVRPVSKRIINNIQLGLKHEDLLAGDRLLGDPVIRLFPEDSRGEVIAFPVREPGVQIATAA